MDSGLLRDALTALAGVATGVMSGSFGVGGAVISTPAIRALGCSAAIAVGTTLPSILPGAIMGSLKYRTSQLVRWRTVLYTVPAGIIAAVIGARIAGVLPGDGHPLMILTAMMLFWSSWNLIRGEKSGTEIDSSDDASVEVINQRSKSAVIGAMAGGLSGLLGVGGGIVMVPMFRDVLKVPMKTAIATSLVCVGFFAVPGTITHTIQGGVDWRYALLLTLGVIPGAPIGARIALSLRDEHLRRIFGIFLACIAVIYATGEIVALAG